jgi:hypothetical protein
MALAAVVERMPLRDLLLTVEDVAARLNVDAYRTSILTKKVLDAAGILVQSLEKSFGPQS